MDNKQTEQEIILQEYLFNRNKMINQKDFSIENEQKMFDEINVNKNYLNVYLPAEIAETYITDDFLRINKEPRNLNSVFTTVVESPDSWGTPSIQIKKYHHTIPDFIKYRIKRNECDYIDFTGIERNSFESLFKKAKLTTNIESNIISVYPISVIKIYRDNTKKALIRSRLILWNDDKYTELDEIVYLCFLFPSIKWRKNKKTNIICGFIHNECVALVASQDDFQTNVQDFFVNEPCITQRIIPMFIKIHIKK